MAQKENHIIDKCMQMDYTRCDPGHITLGPAVLGDMAVVKTRGFLPDTTANLMVFS